jgi:hypothetical protein
MKKVVKKTSKVTVVAAKSSPVLTVEQTKEKISEIKSSMSFLVMESIAISMLSLVLFIGAPSVFPEIINPYLPSSLKIMQGIIVVPTAFLLITVIANLVGTIRIFRLQKALSSKK